METRLFAIAVLFLSSTQSAHAQRRKIVSSQWDTVWVTGGVDDTTLLRPISMTILRSQIYVLDGSASRVVAFDKRTGQVNWIAGRPGGGPSELKNARSIGASTSGVAVADMGNGRIARIDATGRFLKPIRVNAHTHGICAVNHGFILADASSGDLITVDAEGRELARPYLPWPELRGTPALLRQYLLNSTAERCAILPIYGRGFALSNGQQFTEPALFIERVDLPRVEVSHPAPGSTVTQIISDGPPPGALVSAVSGSRLAVAYRGRIKYEGTPVDIYQLTTGSYLETYLWQGKINGIAWDGITFFILTEFDDVPVLIAVRPRRRVR